MSKCKSQALERCFSLVFVGFLRMRGYGCEEYGLNKCNQATNLLKKKKGIKHTADRTSPPHCTPAPSPHTAPPVPSCCTTLPFNCAPVPYHHYPPNVHKLRECPGASTGQLVQHDRCRCCRRGFQDAEHLTDRIISYDAKCKPNSEPSN